MKNEQQKSRAAWSLVRRSATSRGSARPEARTGNPKPLARRLAATHCAGFACSVSWFNSEATTMPGTEPLARGLAATHSAGFACSVSWCNSERQPRCSRFALGYRKRHHSSPRARSLARSQARGLGPPPAASAARAAAPPRGAVGAGKGASEFVAFNLELFLNAVAISEKLVSSCLLKSERYSSAARL